MTIVRFPDKAITSKRDVGLNGGMRKLLIALGGVVVMAAAGCGASEPTPEPEPTANAADAEKKCIEELTPMLKAPATASFIADKTIRNGQVFTLTGTVDSENSFGALIRTRYYCEAEFIKFGQSSSYRVNEKKFY